MAKILSNDEIEDLFAEVNKDRPAGEGDRPERTTADPTSHRSVGVFDFTKPNRFSPQQIQALWRLHEMAANRLQLSLSTLLRLGVRVELMDLEQVRFETLVDTIPNPSVVSVLEATPLRYGALLAMDFGLGYAIIERLLGGSGGNDPGQPRELTQLEFVVVDSLLAVLFHDLEETWNRTVPIKFRVIAHESNPQYARVIPPKEVVIVVTYGIGGELGFGELRICLPHLGLEPYLDALSGQITSAGEERERGAGQSVQALKAARVDVRGVMGRAEVPFRDVVDIAPGDVLPLDRGLGDPVEVVIAGQPKFLARAVHHRGALALVIERELAPTPPTADARAEARAKELSHG